MIALFDLDGTLTDPREGILGSARYALERLGVPAPSDEMLASFIGPPLRGMFAALLAGSGPHAVEEAVRLYRERYREIGIFQTRMYEGVPEMLEGTARIAEALFLVTSKPWMFAERILEHLGLAEHFRRVYGPELDGRFDDKGELLAHLLASERVAADRCVMIGDRSADVTAALANGARPVGVLWGYGSVEELTTAGATSLCSTPADLPPLLAELKARY